MGDEAGFRVGLGYDSHRLAGGMLKPPWLDHGTLGKEGGAGRPLVIGGVEFASPVGPVAHSDGDALMHAITDAVLGGAGLPDIGQLFPDHDPRWAGGKSEVFLREAVRLARERGWAIVNVDATVIVEAPKIGARKNEIRASLARVLGVDAACVNVKGKTHELGGAAEDRIEAMAVVLLKGK